MTTANSAPGEQPGCGKTAKWIAGICGAGILAFIGWCSFEIFTSEGPDLSTPEGRATAFLRCAGVPLDVDIQERLLVPDSYERWQGYWLHEDGGYRVSVEGSGQKEVLIQSDQYPKYVYIEFRSQNALGITLSGEALAIVDAKICDFQNRPVIVSVE